MNSFFEDDHSKKVYIVSIKNEKGQVSGKDAEKEEITVLEVDSENVSEVEVLDGIFRQQEREEET